MIALLPVFLLFVVTHVALIAGGIIGHLPELSRDRRGRSRRRTGRRNQRLGISGLLLVFIRAYSLGGGTYTGIEAVSNGVPIMREPQVHTAKRTMIYMATSLAFTASGLLFCYLLWHVAPARARR